jgi:maltose/moltooligosaccharide transporter
MAVLVMCLLPNSGSLGLTVGAAMMFGLVALMFLDTSINMAMQPFKMMVGDMVNERQKANAYSIQSFLCNAGSVVGSTSNGVNSSDWYRWDTIRRDYHEHHQIRF